LLVAEDNRVNQVVARRHLERMGHEVVVVDDGQQAVDLTARERFDVVLMDVAMPVMGGLDATAMIRQRERGTTTHLRIMGLTAHAMQGDRERCLEAGMDDYATKPIDPTTLREALQRISGSCIDLAPLRTALCDEDLLRDLAQQFCEAGKIDLVELKEALLRSDLNLVVRLAHRLAGGASEFRASLAVSACREVERLAHAGDPPSTLSAIDVATLRLNEVFRALEAELSVIGG
jgi:protein-histidine pros-kinase